MSSLDSPDWSTITTINYGGVVTDAPDWTNVVSGPGGGVIPGVTLAASNQPQDIGVAGWTIDYRLCEFSTIKPTAGKVYTCLVQAISTTTTNNVLIYINTPGTTVSTTQTFMALWDASFASSTPLAVSDPAATASVFDSAITSGTTRLRNVNFTSSASITAGTYYNVVLLVNGGTSPVFGAGPFPTESPSGSSFTSSFATTGTGFTSLASNAFAATLGAQTPQLWAAIGFA